MFDKGLNLEEINAIRESWKIALTETSDIALVFYNRLFYLDGRLRPLFKEDIQTQAKKFFQYLSFIIDNVEDFERIRPELVLLGTRHKEYNVKETDYAVGAEALIFMLAKTLDVNWNETTKKSWIKLYWMTVHAMLERGDEFPLNP